MLRSAAVFGVDAYPVDVEETVIDGRLKMTRPGRFCVVVGGCVGWR